MKSSPTSRRLFLKTTAAAVASSALADAYICCLASCEKDGKRNVAERHFGAFGFPASYGHQPVDAKSIGFNMEVVGGAVGSLCEAWRAATTFDKSCHHVNLLFARESDAISIKSVYPLGALKVEVRKEAPLMVRLPRLVSRDGVALEGIESTPRFEGNSIAIDKTVVGKPIRIPMPPRVSEIELDHHSHRIKVRMRRDSVVAVENFGMPLTFFDPP
jgi:hypothetical protein